MDGACINAFDSHLSVFIEQAVALLTQRLVIHHIDALERRFFELLELVEDLLLQRGGLLGLLKFVLNPLLHGLLCLDLLVLRREFIAKVSV